ncbi:Arylsulfatase [Pontiella desulfatans]|uniref:Arylsulfatase n=1 Tax=Pontiella desulfatans TaxID=2750659 RepID=A0A6C2TZW7_PONDE|nr:sulfatase [Pontiella desulfatans]SPS73740.1 sulfatase S1_7 [Kiritimatiellales bacterium]VGO13109.1 Arylsulfatase [Pontiella desulfatans]
MSLFNRVGLHCAWLAMFCGCTLAAERVAVDGRASKQPNILFLCVDDLRPDIGAYGRSDLVTPNIDRLAARGARFDRAYVCYPLCSPSRAGVLTGLRVGFGKHNEQIQAQDTLPRTLKNAGYYTAVNGKLYHGGVIKSEKDAWDVAGEKWHDGIQDWSDDLAAKVVAHGGRADAWDHLVATGQGSGDLVWASMDVDDNALNDGKTASKTIELLRNRPKDKPFFIAAGFVRPHLPWIAPKKYYDLYPESGEALAYMPDGAPREFTRLQKKYILGNKASVTGWNEGVDDETARGLIRGYRASTSYVDAQIGRVIEELKAQGIENDTIIVIWGDHGWHLTDHGMWRKNTPYHVALRCPMIIVAPGRGVSGQVVGSVVETVDLYPTLLDLAGLPTPAAVDFDGKSLVPLLDNTQAELGGGVAYYAAKKGYGLVTEQYRFFMLDGYGKDLFDLSADIHEWNDLADDPEYAGLVEEYTKKTKAAWSLP